MNLEEQRQQVQATRETLALLAVEVVADGALEGPLDVCRTLRVVDGDQARGGARTSRPAYGRSASLRRPRVRVSPVLAAFGRADAARNGRRSADARGAGVRRADVEVVAVAVAGAAARDRVVLAHGVDAVLVSTEVPRAKKRTANAAVAEIAQRAADACNGEDACDPVTGG